ncbi:MAG TPA: UDP-N-acetylmuramoyl-L-alanyl-D-glutamate--2,6-diaminopimelate ligase [bacterium]|nr:UDP-N-acetylmuramoyl-L-alanyl-D-glutamate--2,6-diaminopimelate ligase [bacterium]HPS28768.1 UDP-N-acetylmuramoyl-L-alanyl-D-glutamate--2,6-diaminopimelate ligase [bacterium]
MRTNDFLKIAGPFILTAVNGDLPSDLMNITADSREVKPGTVFFCLRGHNSDGHKYISSAVEKGASIVVGEDEVDASGYLRVSSVEKFLKAVSPLFYDHPEKKMKMIAVTGTNGKTSTTYIIENILKGKFSCGVTGTLGYRYPGRVIDAANTTPQNWKWYSLLNEMQNAGVEVVISEVSSHAIEEERIETTKFDIAVFTNLTMDHLDFHKDLENYFKAKKKLFTKHLKDNGTAIINIDDEYGLRLNRELPDNIRKISISTMNVNADLYIEIKDTGIDGSSVIFKYGNARHGVHIPLAGRFNIYNTASGFIAAMIVAGSEYSLKEVSKKIIVPGRLEKVGSNPVYIDYAHTPDALENVLSTLKGLNSKGRIITVFGAGGDRDRGKRPVMGEIVSKLSDIVIITDDNPRTEDPETIINEILSGCNSGNKVIEVIHDRKTAIRRAIDVRNGLDVILIAGKGAENYQITKEGKRFFSDKEEVEKYLEELQHVHNNLS